MQNKRSAEENARDLLNNLWVNKDFPVDPAVIATKLGIQVEEANLPKGISGILLKKQGEDARIMVHRGDSRSRRRFSIAHELGHFILRSTEGDEEFGSIDYRDNNSSTGTDPEEVFANQFAANLLMPREEIDRQKHKGALSMSMYFDVSMDAMNNRLSSLGLTGK